MPSEILVLCLGLLNKMIVTPPIVYILQAELNVKESQVVDLQENIKSQQFETSKAKDELTTALVEMVKLKKYFKADQAGWETEKSALLKRIKKAEMTLKLVAEELAGFKHQINAMSVVIFDK